MENLAREILPHLSNRDQTKLKELYAHIKRQADSFIGYPCNRHFDYSPLYRFLEYPINNVGDPFASSTYRVNTRAIEREVLEWFANLYHAPANQYWGYINNGGTEGNMYGLYLARELHPGGIVYHSQDRHYSIDKITRVLGIEAHMIRSQTNGEMDYADLRESLRMNAERPAIILANIGTTMKQAVDDIPRIRQILAELGLRKTYVHCDAALAGMVLPFIDNPPPFDFRAGIDSISVSGHKMVGAPVPCGIVLVRKEHVSRVARTIEYVGIVDTTLTGSRNGFSPLLMWYAIRSKTREQFEEMISGCFKMADYAIRRFEEIGVKAWRNPHGITVVFPRPPQDVLDRWQIAVENDIAHIITMPHVDEQMIDRLMADMKENTRGRTVKEITIFADNNPGVIADISELLGKQDINIETIDCETIGDEGVIIFTVDQYHKALAALKESPFRLMNSDAVLVRIPDKPGALAEVAARFKTASVNIKSLRLTDRHEGYALATITTDNPDVAVKLLDDIIVTAD